MVRNRCNKFVLVLFWFLLFYHDFSLKIEQMQAMALLKSFLLIHVVDKMLCPYLLNKLVQEDFVVNMYHVNLAFIQLMSSLLVDQYQIVLLVLMLHHVCIIIDDSYVT